MASKIPQEIHDLVPEELRDDYGIYWSARSSRYYVFRDLGYVYDPKIKRSRVQRQPLGSIKDGVFAYSPSWLDKQAIKKLSKQNDRLQRLTAKPKAQAAAADGSTGSETRSAADALTETSCGIDDALLQTTTPCPLGAILTAALLASFTGDTSAVSIAIYWRKHAAELAQIIDDFPAQAPSHDAINRVLRLIDKERMATLLRQLAVPPAVEASKRLLHIKEEAHQTLETEGSGLDALNVYDFPERLVVTHSLINEKENENSALIALLSDMALGAGDILTGDGSTTPKELADFLQGHNVDYCLSVKEDAPKLYSEVQRLFGAADESRFRLTEDIDCGRGKIKTQRIAVLPASLLSRSCLEAWPCLANGCIIRAANVGEKRARATANQRKYVTSSARFPARRKTSPLEWEARSGGLGRPKAAHTGALTARLIRIESSAPIKTTSPTVSRSTTSGSTH